MIDLSILDDVFSTLSDLKNELTKASITLHEDGYHDYSNKLATVRNRIEEQEHEVADLWETMSNLKGAKQ